MSDALVIVNWINSGVFFCPFQAVGTHLSIVIALVYMSILMPNMIVSNKNLQTLELLCLLENALYNTHTHTHAHVHTHTHTHTHTHIHTHTLDIFSCASQGIL